MRGTGGTTRIVVDAFAWVEYLAGTPLGERSRGHIDDESNEVYTAALSVSEIVSRGARGGEDGRALAEKIEAASAVVPMDFTLAVSTGLLHAERRKKVKDSPYGDAAVQALAHRMKAKILTGDPHFRNEPQVIFLD